MKLARFFYSPETRLLSCLIRLSSLLTILFIFINFGCQKHTNQKTNIDPSPSPKLRKYLSAVSDQAPLDHISMRRGMKLFVEKCSACHEPDRALTVLKDPEVWAQTIKRMQYYSKGAITNQQAKELVDFHVTEQQKEINAFKETCTQCHDDERINSRSMSEEQWLATIKRMQQKAPDLISDEKINLLVGYFHRRELSLARIFYGKCRLCHLDNSSPDSTVQMNGLIVLANEEFGRSLQVRKVNNILSIHTQRQKRNMQLYEKKCTTCHPGKIPEKKGLGKKNQEERTRAEWISIIAVLQGMELNKEIQNTINSQIDYHISRH
jgi:cytochrome c5